MKAGSLTHEIYSGDGERKKEEDIKWMGITLIFVCIFYSCSIPLQALCSVHLDALMSHNDSPQLLQQAVTDAQTCKMLYYPESGLVLILDCVCS